MAQYLARADLHLASSLPAPGVHRRLGRVLRNAQIQIPQIETNPSYRYLAQI